MTGINVSPQGGGRPLPIFHAIPAAYSDVYSRIKI
jgi:hypothetical protein